MNIRWVYALCILIVIGGFIGAALLYKGSFYEVIVLEGKTAELVDVKSCEGDFVKKEIIRDGKKVISRVYIVKRVKDLLPRVIPVALLISYGTIMSLILLRKYGLSMENLFRRTAIAAFLVYAVQSIAILLGSISTGFHGLLTLTDIQTLCTALGITKLFETALILYLSPILKNF